MFQTEKRQWEEWYCFTSLQASFMSGFIKGNELALSASPSNWCNITHHITSKNSTVHSGENKSKKVMSNFDICEVCSQRAEIPMSPFFLVIQKMLELDSYSYWVCPSDLMKVDMLWVRVPNACQVPECSGSLRAWTLVIWLRIPS